MTGRMHPASPGRLPQPSVDPSPRSRSPELRSVAKSIEVMFPDAADLLRGIARELDPPNDEWVEETRTEHRYKFYGRVLSGYGPSMDPHRCGDPAEPCVTITETRKVTPWRETARVKR